MAGCLDCQYIKAKSKHLGGLLQPIEVPEWKWVVICMDFVKVIQGQWSNMILLW